MYIYIETDPRVPAGYRAGQPAEAGALCRARGDERGGGWWLCLCLYVYICVCLCETGSVCIDPPTDTTYNGKTAGGARIGQLQAGRVEGTLVLF